MSTTDTYPKKVDGRTVWACCESTIGPLCMHLVHPEAVAAMRRRIEHHVVPGPVPGAPEVVDYDALALDLARHMGWEVRRAGDRGKGKIREQRAMIKHLRKAAGMTLPVADERRVMALIDGGLQMAINEHGPITPDMKSSATKRIYNNLLKHRLLQGLGREEGL